MHGDESPTMPPVRLPSEAELARDALAAPLFSRAVRLARWAGSGVRVGAGGELLGGQLKEAAGHLGLQDDEEGPYHASEAWHLALDTGLVEVAEDEDAEPTLESDEPVGTAAPGDELGRVTGEGGPADVLEVWSDGFESVLQDAATPSLEDVVGEIEGAVGPDGQLDPDAVGLDSLDFDAEAESDFLDGALGNLYLLAATDPAVADGSMVPLPVLAASMIVPDDMDEPTDEVLESVSSAMMRLDEQFRILAPTGLVEYQPVDEALTQESEGELPEEPDDEDVSRYGMVRLTPLGLYGVRQRMLAAGLDVPLVGDLAGEDAGMLLDAVPSFPEESARQEFEQWLAARTVLDAARELLAAARGQDGTAPARRLACQQALTLAGAEAEPALREVLDDRELGGLARVWLVENGARDVPQPDEEMVFWLTVDTLAAQLATAGEPDELRDLVQGLVDQHTGFFDRAWQVDHPSTADVLEAMGRIHPDKRTAKEARKAAFKARSQSR
ncbi:hypothetical protein DVA86_10570 [Streptomyces armeniacus]|uniref:Uncharacterized protein n=1 Tax=Streptomyces armeniacus TaxID=83291 RepID=A0A345XN10_9ACTN|nr:hypothetical protein [Streptomyces armeniacus]AXK33026.1 hypothetical protein DVA86_10570 [Streptomyces armeniacus]